MDGRDLRGPRHRRLPGVLVDLLRPGHAQPVRPAADRAARPSAARPAGHRRPRRRTRGRGAVQLHQDDPGHLDLLSYDLTPDEIHSLAGLVIAAGDAFTSELARRWLEFAGPGGTPVATEYGPTEITVGNSGETLTEPPATELIPLGAPIPNTTMYVLTDRLEPVPVGVPGEVYIGGTGVARGYLDRPGLTAERFLPDPYGAPGSCLYRTGDRARWRADGSLEFLGRVDHQVKIRGFRVELGEIQARLRDHADVAEAVVIAVGPVRSRSLAAYVIPAEGTAMDATGLREHLAAVLPAYMLPAHFVAIDQVPLTTNGKVDTRVLQGLL
ncbi:AMP-binding protein [Streptomyces sp. JCM17656]|nr:AMP-binding protein [Streptomyces sp. JCM17656]